MSNVDMLECKDPQLIWVAVTSSHLILKNHRDAKESKILDIGRCSPDLSVEESLNLSFNLAITKNVVSMSALVNHDARGWLNLFKKLCGQREEVFEGELTQKTSAIFQSNKQSWCVVRGGKFSCYAELHSPTPEYVLELGKSTVRTAKWHEDPRAFFLTEGEKTYQFLGRNRNDSDQWMKAITRAIEYAQKKAEKPIRQGYLYKDPNRVLSRARYRWCVLKKGTLEWFTKPGESVATGSMNLKNGSVKLGNKSDFSFFISEKSGTKKYVMMAPSREEQIEWVADLEAEIRRCSKVSERTNVNRKRANSASGCLETFFPEGQERKKVKRAKIRYIAGENFPIFDWDSDGSGSDVEEDVYVSDAEDLSEPDEDKSDEKSDEDGDGDVKPSKSKKSAEKIPEKKSRNSFGRPADLLRVTSHEHDRVSLVVDNGTHSLRAGFAGDLNPRCVLPSSLLYALEGLDGIEHQPSWANYRDSPFNKADIDWDHASTMWDYLFSFALSAFPQERDVVMVEPSLVTVAGRQKMKEILFEEYSVGRLSLQPAPLLALLSTGQSTGVCVQWGNSLSVQAISDGYVLPHASQSRNFGGNHLTELFLKMLRQEQGMTLTLPEQINEARQIKESLCYVAADLQKEAQLFKKTPAKITRKIEFKTAPQVGETSTRLAAGRKITIGAERFLCPEALFDPAMAGSLGGNREKSIQQLVYDCINLCDINVRRSLYSSILVSGGNTLFPGFPERLTSELIKLTPTSMSVKVKSPSNRRYSAWRGGSVFATLPHFGLNAISIEDYRENGIQD
eukprot:TRINITY_DN12483_c0_g1_i1.p1 TRINITY_DN12483_c0_g1~~TRINITY_DN12483_c0_g1_i1.p1  ORF type:complete len:831 (+),score=183.13 TRINITY_DN12483_c0_g1_i1:123-2495(+)